MSRNDRDDDDPYLDIDEREARRNHRRDRLRHARHIVDGNDLRNGAMQGIKKKRISYRDYL